MIWQDFLFACAAYAEEEPLRSEVIAEARDNVTRLMPHPSLVAVERLQREHLGLRRLGLGRAARRPDLGRRLLLRPPAVHRGRARSRPAVRGRQPVVVVAGPAPQRPGPRHHAHLGRVEPARLHRLPRLPAAVRGRVRLAGAADLVDAARAPSATSRSPRSRRACSCHQKAADGNVKLTGGLVPHFPVPDTMDDWHWAMSLNQARAVGLAVEYFRSLHPTVYRQRRLAAQRLLARRCPGAPIDGDGRRKPLLYALRHAHADRLVTVQPDGDGLRVVLVNDTADALDRDRCGVSWRTFDGASLASGRDLRSTCRRGRPSPCRCRAVARRRPGAPISWWPRRAGGRGLWFFAEDRDSGPAGTPCCDSTVDAVEGGYDVTVTAGTRAAGPRAPGRQARPGRGRRRHAASRCCRVRQSRCTWRPPGCSTRPTWSSRACLRCANQLVHRASTRPDPDRLPCRCRVRRRGRWTRPGPDDARRVRRDRS